MNLFTIEQEILSCLDAETGEIIDTDKLEALCMEKERKVNNVAKWIKNLEAESGALENQKKVFAERQKSVDAQIERLKSFLALALNGEKFKSAECVVTFRKSEPVNILDESKLPKKYLRKKVTYSPDKEAIKTAIKSGLKVRGAELISKLNAQIK